MTTSAASRRSKSGYLELHKGGKNWKRYLFKVTGSTYFHYFGEKNAAKAKEEILLANVRSVEVPSKLLKGGMHVFEVRFAGKGSPWVISASTQEEQMSWMEAIRPGSSSIVTQYSRVAQLSPPPEASGRTSPMPQLTANVDVSPATQPGMQAASGYSMMTQTNQGIQLIHGLPQGSQVMPGQSIGYQSMPSHSLEPQVISTYSLAGQPLTEHSPGVPVMSGHSPGVPSAYSPGVQGMAGYSPGVPGMSGLSPGDPAITGLSPGVPAMSAHSPGVRRISGYSPGNPAVTGTPVGTQVMSELSPSFQMTSGNTNRSHRQSPGRGLDEPCPPQADKNYDEFQPPKSTNPYVTEPYLDPVSITTSVPRSQYPSQAKRLGQHSASVHISGSPRYPHTEDPTTSLPASTATNHISHHGMRRAATERLAISNLDNAPRARPRSPTVPPRPKETLPPESEQEYTDMSGSQSANKYLVVTHKPTPVPRKVKSEYMLLEAAEESAEYTAMSEILTNQFTQDQLRMLRRMLEKMKVGEESTLANAGTAKGLGYVMAKTANTVKETMLVTEEDDPDTYDERPLWAKAVYDESVPADEDELGEDLEQHVCTIPFSELSNLTKIGSGQFGEVFRAHYSPGGCIEESITVAVKKTKDDCPQKEKESLLQEMSIMSQLVHPNIVKLYGVVTQDVPAPWVVLEYLPCGDLRNYLVTHSSRTHDQLVKYMVDVAMGMHYLAERGLVHRDLAARNVLVGEGELCKVADFGLMRELPKDNSIYQSTSNTPCPIRWMAPECISHRQYSLASDVWAFGILQWEMFNPKKKVPYPGIDNLQVVVKVTTERYRMPIPRGCPQIVARVMKACWHSDPKRRPSFRLITTLLTTKGLQIKQPSSTDKPSSPPDMYV